MVRRGISPVIATVIIVAVAIAIAVAVAAWIMGLYGHYSEYGALQVTYGSLRGDGQGNYTLTLVVRNTGTSTVHIASISVGDHNIEYSASIPPGNPVSITVGFQADDLVPGQQVQVTVYTAEGTTAIYTLTVG